MVKSGITSFLKWYPNTIYLFGVYLLPIEMRAGNDPKWYSYVFHVDEDSSFFDHEFNVQSDFDEFANRCIKGWRGPRFCEDVEIHVEISESYTDHYYCVHLSKAENVCGPWNGEDKYLVLMNVGY